METIVRTLRPITNSVPAPPAPAVPTIPATTRVRLGQGGGGRAAWEVWIEPFDGNPGVAVRFPWVQRQTRDGARHWEQLEARMISQRGTYTLADCPTWVPGSGLLLTGLARDNVASVRFVLVEQPSVTVATFGQGKDVPWVAYASPVIQAGTQVARVLSYDAAGQLVGGEEDPFRGRSLCRPR